MSHGRTSLALLVVSLFLGGCTSPQSTQLGTPTPVPLNELVRTLSDQETSASRLVLALFDLEKVDPAPVQVIPILLRLLEHDDPHVRIRAINALAYMGSAAACAVPKIAVHLWDSDRFVRTGAATALDYITHVKLVESYAKFKRGEDSFFADQPEGEASGKAREWWKLQGQYRDWSSSQNYCEIQP